jgi:hypothetical protein
MISILGRYHNEGIHREHHANEHGFESYTVKIINNFFPSVAQEEELLS